MGPSALRSRLRALWSLDITVPIGQLSTDAISRYESPSTSLSMIMVRALGGKASSAWRMRWRRSAPTAAWSGALSGSSAVRSHSSAGMAWLPNARAWALRERSRSVATFMAMRKSQV